jgi:hypothetical protein
MKKYNTLNFKKNNNFVYKNNQPKLNYVYSLSSRTAPVAGFRKKVHCTSNSKCVNEEKIYKDTYSKCKIFCNYGRSSRPLIKSGMQPSKDSNGNLVEYSYSYREYLKNKRNKTYNSNLINKVVDETKNIYSNGRGKLCSDNTCSDKITYKINNKHFSKQGSVDSSLRLQKLKYDTILSETKCKDKIKCNGIYFAGKPRFTGFIFNNTHKELGCPQNKARGKSRGFFIKKCN